MSSNLPIAIKLKHKMSIRECADRATVLSNQGLLTPTNMFRRPLCGSPGKWVHQGSTPQKKGHVS